MKWYYEFIVNSNFKLVYRFKSLKNRFCNIIYHIEPRLLIAFSSIEECYSKLLKSACKLKRTIDSLKKKLSNDNYQFKKNFKGQFYYLNP